MVSAFVPFEAKDLELLPRRKTQAMLRMRKHLLLCALVAGFVGAPPVIMMPGGAPAAAAQAGQALQPLQIVTKSGAHAFSVEIARTEAERERGLMYRRFMPQDRGMLFDFKTPQTITMWMKNTYIPLDMIFIGRDGRVTSLAPNAEPLSERIISSSGPAYAVLEVNAGVIAATGVAVGDQVDNPLFHKGR